MATTSLIRILPLLLLAGCSVTAPPPAPPTDAHAGQGIQVQKLLQTTQSWDGQTLPAYPAGQPQVTILKITIAPGVALPDHQHPVINAGVLLEGTLDVVTEHGHQITLHAGDALSETVNTWHHGSNPGPAPAIILVVYAGQEGTPITVKRQE